MFDHPGSVEAGSTISCDICIVGGGPAGITLAVELIRSQRQVLLIEAGGFQTVPVDENHPYEGTCVGIPYPLLGSRLRYFGGTSNHWGGWCRPLDPFDFKEKPYVPFSGWPIPYSELPPFYERAEEFCEISPPGFGLGSSEQLPAREEFFDTYDPDLTVKNFRFSPPTRFGRRYRPPLDKATNVRCLLESSAVEIEATGDSVSGLLVRAGSKSFRVKAKNYVLAMGAIENARLLLHSDKVFKNGIGNDNGFVGRFFADHVGRTIGSVLTSEASPYVHRVVDGVAIFPHLCFREEFLEREALLNFGVVFLSGGEQPLLHENYLSNELFQGWRGGLEKKYFHVVVRLETAPNPNSVVRLGRAKDVNGVRRVELDFRLSGLEEYCLNRIADLLGRKIGAHAMGRFRQTFFGGEEFRQGDFSTQAHHLGTTRMSQSSSSGVVDPDCKVHGVTNLFVAGSSVFPTFGFANPTLTLVALAVRLAGHLRRSTAA